MTASLSALSAPQIRPLNPRRGTVLAVLDIGSSKVVCLIVKLMPMEGGVVLRGRTHRCKVLGVGQQHSKGVKNGAVVDLDLAEYAIRMAVDAAERMAGFEVESVIVNLSGGRIKSKTHTAAIPLSSGTVTGSDMHKALSAAAFAGIDRHCMSLHRLHAGYALDGQRDIADPQGMVGETLTAAVNVVDCDASVARNLMLLIERCHLRVATIVASPYAAGLATLVDDEAELGAALIDFGAGTTTVSVFAKGGLVHVDGIPVGGTHVTMDIARGLSISLADAERLKTTYAACVQNVADEREIISIHRVGDEKGLSTQITRTEVLNIVRPRVEEIVELVRDRLRAAGFAAYASRRLILTGGASQLPGLSDLVNRILSSQARMGRPLGVESLPDIAKTQAFATSIGLALYPQVAGLEHNSAGEAPPREEREDVGYVGRVKRWLQKSF